jgi:uncharacterized membrane protein
VVEARRGLPAVLSGSIAAFIALFIYLGIRQLLGLRIGGNSGTYLQSALSFLHHLNTHNLSDHTSNTAQHDQWMLIVLCPFVALWPHVETVMIVQVVSVAASAIVLWYLVQALGGTRGAATALSLAWLVSPSLEGFAFGDFTPEEFVPLLGFALALAIVRRAPLATLILAQLLFGVKEDVLLLTVWTCAIVLWRTDRRVALAIAALGAVNLGVYEFYAAVHHYHSVLPGYGLRDPHPLEHVLFLLEVLVPLAFAPLRLGWRMLIVLPFLAELFLVQGYAGGLLVRSGSYYTTPLVTLFGIGTAVVVARLPPTANVALGLSVLCALTLNPTVLRFGRHLSAPDPLYPVARAWAGVDAPVAFPCADQGAWVVAATNPQADLVGCDEGMTRQRTAYRDIPLGSTAAWTHGPGAGRSFLRTSTP